MLRAHVSNSERGHPPPPPGPADESPLMGGEEEEEEEEGEEKAVLAKDWSRAVAALLSVGKWKTYDQQQGKDGQAALWSNMDL